MDFIPENALLKPFLCYYRYWNNEFELFYNPTTGLDIDGSWIDMNEPASVCPLVFHSIPTKIEADYVTFLAVL